MSQEIERKFLVNGEFKSLAKESFRIAQGYLSSVPDRTVRIRIKGDKGFITIKGKSSASGMSRYEWEKEIPLLEAQELLTLCETGTIEKTRYLVVFENNTFEVDEFYGDNEGLLIAEIELDSETSVFSKPNWLGEEVTNDDRYYNAQLSKNPFRTWK
jgi:adenylate cyclase